MSSNTAPNARRAQPVGPTPTLSFADGPVAGERVRLDRDVTTVGRNEDNDCVLPDPRVSRVHAEIRREGGTFILTDLGSSSGTRRNGEALVGPTVVRHGDEIRFGPLTARLEDLTAASDDEDTTLVFATAPPPQQPQLSPRQEQVLGLMAEGLTNRQIAEEIGVTERTVKAYAQELYDRLHVHNRAEAVATGMRLGLV